MSARSLYLFDIDGTLVDSPKEVEGAGRLAFEEALEEIAGLKRGLQGVVLHGNTDPAILDEAWQSHFGRHPTPAEAKAVLDRYVLRLTERTRVPGVLRILPAVPQCLDRLIGSQAWVGLATGNIESGARVKLESVGLWSRFPFGGFGSDAGDRAELVRTAIKKAEIYAKHPFASERVWVVGDTPRDVQAAHRAGVRCIAVATGMHPTEELAKAGADLVIPTLASFPPEE